METVNRALIKYSRDGEWSGYTLSERTDGTWIYEGWSRVQGTDTGYKCVIQPPEGWSVEDEDDMDTRLNNWGYTKADDLIQNGNHVRVLRRGHEVQ